MSTRAAAKAIADRLGIELSIGYDDAGRLGEVEIWTLNARMFVLDPGSHVAIECRENYDSAADMWRAVVALLRTVAPCDCVQCEPAPAGWRPGDEKRISCEECARNTAYIIATFGEPEDGLAVIVCPQCGKDVAPGELMHVTGPLVPESITVETNKGPVPVRLSPARGGAWRVFNGGFYAGTVSWDERGYVVTSPTVNTWQMARHATLSDAVSDCIERTGRAM